MTDIDKQEQEEHTQNYQHLIKSQQTLLLATVSSHAEPECSYAPFVTDEHKVFYIFVSELAIHTKNMIETQKASILFIKPEHETKNFFVRERVIFDCIISEIQQNDELYNRQLSQMNDQFGETVELLRSLPDFHLLALTPVKGRYIAGFGKAFMINMTDGSLGF
ncbi:MAG: pyridoxamine 5'-phosphate oxidase family protein [Methylococcaceae bacterium]|nr:pyridoxamine 5'-phosphate oxidase family protein [Methylococcaceae bacterium]